MNRRRDEYLEVRVKAFRNMEEAFVACIGYGNSQAVYLTVFDSDPGMLDDIDIGNAAREAQDD